MQQLQNARHVGLSKFALHHIGQGSKYKSYYHTLFLNFQNNFLCNLIKGSNIDLIDIFLLEYPQQQETRCMFQISR